MAGNRWLGPGARQPAATVALRGLGAREVAVHGIALAILARGGPVRPWLAASIAGNLADITAAFASRSGLPEGSAGATAAVASGSAALTGIIAAGLEEQPAEPQATVIRAKVIVTDWSRHPPARDPRRHPGYCSNKSPP